MELWVVTIVCDASDGGNGPATGAAQTSSINMTTHKSVVSASLTTNTFAKLCAKFQPGEQWYRYFCAFQSTVYKSCICIYCIQSDTGMICDRVCDGVSKKCIEVLFYD